MKTRTFKAPGLQHVYDMFRDEESQGANYLRNSAVGNAFRAGMDDHRDPGVPTSIAHVAWAAGADIRADRLAAERALYDEMDGSAAMDVPVEDLY